METKKLPGAIKVAILIQSMNEIMREKILSMLGEKEKALLKQYLSNLGFVTPEMIENISSEFLYSMDMLNTGQIAQKLLSESTEDSGDEENKPKKKRPDAPPPKGTLEVLDSMEIEQLVDLIKDEMPQTIAVILVHLDTEKSGKVLSLLPDNIKSEVSIRTARLDKVMSNMIDDINDAFKGIIENSETTISQKSGGALRLAEILNQMNGAMVETILSEIEEADPELAEEVKSRMFVFEDLILVGDRDLQKVMRNVESRDLAVALKAASDTVKEKIYKNMSERAAEMLKEEIEDLGAVRMKEVEDSQQAITKVIQRMSEKGEIVIVGRGGEQFI